MRQIHRATWSALFGILVLGSAPAPAQTNTAQPNAPDVGALGGSNIANWWWIALIAVFAAALIWFLMRSYRRR